MALWRSLRKPAAGVRVLLLEAVHQVQSLGHFAGLASTRQRLQTIRRACGAEGLVHQGCTVVLSRLSDLGGLITAERLAYDCYAMSCLLFMVYRSVLRRRPASMQRLVNPS